jgi:hypothetical protein
MKKPKKYPYTNTGLAPRLLDLPKDHEYVWDKVLRERAEGNKKFRGGQYHEIPARIADQNFTRGPFTRNDKNTGGIYA